jgi:hypothetical protein
MNDPGFESWIDAQGFRDYVNRCLAGTLGMDAPAICALRDAYRRECLAALVPTWWWQERRGDVFPPSGEEPVP